MHQFNQIFVDVDGGPVNYQKVNGVNTQWIWKKQPSILYNIF